MTQNKLTFESQNITVDYISLNYKYLNEDKLDKTALSFFNLGFNCKKKNSDGEIVNIFYHEFNNYFVVFVEQVYNPKKKSFWDGFIIEFSGDNASQFYRILRKNTLDPEIFNYKGLNLGRLDVYYLYQNLLSLSK